ncbi:hypothetical protein [Endozoicomonas lisbonensis]|uniref:Lipoprotein n=1 Tax=Endozoicomonas lisbonensis TaxID=3120522 RepID=A0ABV2SQ22_9GAMM
MSVHNKTIIFGLCILFVSATLSGCAGRTAHPVTIRQYGDENRSCAALESELRFIELEISRLVPKTDKTGKNVALGVAGAFFLVPWFFMDLSQAEQIEIDAFRQRYNYLAGLTVDKRCDKPRQQIPDFRDPAAFQEEQLKMQQEQLNQLQQQQIQQLQQQQIQQQIEQQKLELEKQEQRMRKNRTTP